MDENPEPTSTILVAVDFSESTDRILQATINLAKAVKNAKVTLVNVAPREPDIFGRQLTRKVITEPVPEDVEERYGKLIACARRIEEAEIPVTPLLVRGDPVRALLREADHESADIIVMGSHGRGALYKQLVGSVSEGVMREARCPVLIIPTKAITND